MIHLKHPTQGLAHSLQLLLTSVLCFRLCGPDPHRNISGVQLQIFGDFSNDFPVWLGESMKVSLSGLAPTNRES